VSALSSQAREAVGGRGSDVTLLSNAWDDQAPQCPARLAANPSWRHPRYQTEHRMQPATDPAGSCCTHKARWVVEPSGLVKGQVSTDQRHDGSSRRPVDNGAGTTFCVLVPLPDVPGTTFYVLVDHLRDRRETGNEHQHEHETPS
jgi:hypothetical protein